MPALNRFFRSPGSVVLSRMAPLSLAPEQRFDDASKILGCKDESRVHERGLQQRFPQALLMNSDGLPAFSRRVE
jgi:hypothetical protein